MADMETTITAQAPPLDTSGLDAAISAGPSAAPAAAQPTGQPLDTSGLDAAISAGPNAAAPAAPSAIPTAGRTGNPMVDLPRIGNTIVGGAVAGALSLPRSIAGLADWAGQQIVGSALNSEPETAGGAPAAPFNPGLSDALGSIPDPTNPAYPAFPTYQQAEEGYFNQTGGTKYVPGTMLGRAAMTGASMLLSGGAANLAERGLARIAGGEVPQFTARTAATLAGSGAGSSIGSDTGQAIAPGNEPLSVFLGLLGGGAPALAHPIAARVAPAMETTAAKTLMGAASEPEAATAAVMAGPDQIVPGSEPTLGQLTNDPGLMERENYARNTVAPEAFRQRANEQTAAQTALVNGLLPLEASPQAAGQFFRDRLDMLQAEDAAQTGADQMAAATALGNIGGYGTPEQAGAAIQSGIQGRYQPLVDAAQAAEAGATDRVAQANAIAGGTRTGTDTQSVLQSYGQDIRAPLAAANARAAAAVSALADAIDPEGTLTVGFAPVVQEARSIVSSMPRLAQPMTGDEAAVFRDVATSPNTIPFGDLKALNTRVTGLMRQARRDPSQNATYARLSQLRDSMADAMQGAAEDVAAREAPEIASGRMAPEDGIVSRVNEAAVQADAVPGNSGPPAPEGVGAGGGAGEVSGASGSARTAEPSSSGDLPSGEAGGQPAGAAGGPRLSGANRKGTPAPSLIGFLTQKGGVQDQGGDLGAMGANRQRVGFIRQSGMPLDRAREAAEEAGYLPSGSGINDLLDVIDEELRGHKQYPWGFDEAVFDRDHAAHDAANRRLFRETRKQVSSLAYGLGVKLTPEEVTHAVNGVVDGLHPEDAIREALLDSHFRTLSGLGDLGPIEPGEEPPTFDRAAAERYLAMRKAHAERMETFVNAPGVGAVLKRGPTQGTFDTELSAVPREIFRRNGQEAAERIRAYYKAGGSREAIEDYAAFDLRQAAMNTDGSLNPSKYATWMKTHSEVLNAMPAVKARFANLADAQEQLSRISAARQALEAQFHKVTGDTAAQAAAMYWQPGPKGGDAIDRLMRESGGSPESMAGVTERAAQTLRDAAIRDGRFQLGAYDNWQRRFAGALSRLPADARAKFDTAAAAEKTVIDGMENRSAAIDQYQKSAARFWLQREPVDAVKAALGVKNSAAEFRQMMEQTKNDPAAQEGIRKAFLDHLLDRGQTNVEAGNTGALRLKKDTLQEFIDHKEPAIREVFRPDQVQALKDLARDLQRTNRTVAGSAPLIGPGTARDLSAASRYARARNLLGMLLGGGSRALMAGLGAYLGEAGGAIAAVSVGEALKEVAASMRASHTAETERLIAHMILNPAQLRTALINATPENIGSIARRFARLSMQSAVTAGKNQ